MIRRKCTHSLNKDLSKLPRVPDCVLQALKQSSVSVEQLPKIREDVANEGLSVQAGMEPVGERITISLQEEGNKPYIIEYGGTSDKGHSE